MIGTARNHLSPSEPEETGMRRAISLSDLAAKPVPAPRTPQGWFGGRCSNRGTLMVVDASRVIESICSSSYVLH